MKKRNNVRRSPRPVVAKLAPGVSAHLATLITRIQSSTGKPAAVVVHPHEAVLEGVTMLCAMGAHIGTLGGGLLQLTTDLLMGETGLAPVLIPYAPAVGLATKVAEGVGSKLGINLTLGTAEGGQVFYLRALDDGTTETIHTTTVAALEEATRAAVLSMVKDQNATATSTWAILLESLETELATKLAPKGEPA